MNCGLPVITSKYGSLAEVAGNAGILVDPQSPRKFHRYGKIYSDNLLSAKFRGTGWLGLKNFLAKVGGRIYGSLKLCNESKKY